MIERYGFSLEEVKEGKNLIALPDGGTFYVHTIVVDVELPCEEEEGELGTGFVPCPCGNEVPVPATIEFFGTVYSANESREQWGWPGVGRPAMAQIYKEFSCHQLASLSAADLMNEIRTSR